MELGLIKDNKISNIIDTSSPENYLRAGWIEIPTGLKVGTDIRLFNIDGDRWSYKTDQELVDDGVLIRTQEEFDKLVLQISNRRAIDYADPIYGVDKLTSEYQRLLITGAADDELLELKWKIVQRYEEIKSNNPYPMGMK